jgi:hypothetical protein
LSISIDLSLVYLLVACPLLTIGAFFEERLPLSETHHVHSVAKKPELAIVHTAEHISLANTGAIMGGDNADVRNKHE